MKFDYIICNPPYSIGDKVVSTVKDYAVQTTVLMPFSKYKKLQEHVKQIDLVSNNGFDASIVNNCIAVLDHNKHDNCSIMEPFVKEFIEENNKLITPWWFTYYTSGDSLKLNDLDIDRDIVVPGRLFENGGFGKTKNCVDYSFNIDKTVIKQYYCCAVIKCPSSKLKDGLSHYLHLDDDFRKRLQGAHSSSCNKILFDLIPKNLFVS